MSWSEIVRTVILVATFALLSMALLISLAPTLRRMVNTYILQASTLAVITFLTPFEALSNATASPVLDLPNLVLSMSLGILPVVLAIFVRPLLARATVQGQFSLLQIFDRKATESWIRDADPVWLEHGRSRVGQFANILVNLLLTVLAFFIAFQLVSGSRTLSAQAIDPISLAISLALLLNGLFTMIAKTDIISQVMGLLVMEHGLFLAAIKVVGVPGLTTIFVVSMFAYILVTLFILVFLLPALHAATGSIEIDEINRASSLKG